MVDICILAAAPLVIKVLYVIIGIIVLSLFGAFR